jgi:uncharacterized membrane protein YgcG
MRRTAMPPSPGRHRILREHVRGRAARVALLLGWLLLLTAPAVSSATATLSFPPQTPGQWVYDEAGIWSDAAKATAETRIAAIETRSGAQIVAYSQRVGYDVSEDDAKAQAAALGNQWGVGRKGFDDGLVMLFDIDPSGIHGHVVMVGGDGFRAAYLSDADTTRIFDESMLPYLKQSPPDYDAALLSGLREIDASITPENTANLARARTIDAILGLVVAPLAAILLSGWALFHWLRFGRDPHYIDDPSILMPAPPDALTAASGALLFDGASSRRTLTTALLDLASRGRLAFEERHGLLHSKVAVLTETPEETDPTTLARRRLVDRRPLSGAETYALDELRAASDGGVVEGQELLEFGKKVAGFDERLEDHAVAMGWFREAPGKVRRRWIWLAVVEASLAVACFISGVNVPISGLVLVALGVGAGAVVTFAIAFVMPARTLTGASLRAMLAAYRRTLQYTMAAARSMDQVVAEAKLAWLETPDQAFVWGVALGLQSDVDRVLQRSMEDLRRGTVAHGTAWMPVYWHSAGGTGGGGGGFGGSTFSGSAVPNVAGMLAVLGTVGNAPSSSGGGGGGGGGFSGGGGGSF